MEELVTSFGDNWEAEKKKQKSMAKRATDLLFTWACFSEACLSSLSSWLLLS